MSHKRVLEEEDGEHSDVQAASPPRSKRAKKQGANSHHHQHQNAHIDPTWGQKYVFSSQENATTIPVGEESDFEDDADAMAYLMSVRHQATGIPHLLVAPKIQIGPQLPAYLETANADDGPYDDDHAADPGHVPEGRAIYETGHSHSAGYYEDGAYFDLGNEDELEEGEEPELHTDPATAMQEAYFAALMRSYMALRQAISNKPPRDASKRLPASHLTHAAPFGRTSHTTSTWTNILTTLDPHPLQLALLSKDSLFTILRVMLNGQLLQRGKDLPERMSRWLWALLARLPEPGELTHWELGCVRDLGKRAVLLGRSLEEIEALREEVEEGLDGVEKSDGEQVLEHDKAPTGPSEAIESKLEPGSPLPTSQDAEDGEQPEDVAMDLESSDEDDSPPKDLEEMRKRLLAQLDEDEDEGEDAAQREAEARARMNMRATINMILTVIGEFYGQRDLLEFREAFATT